MTQANNTQSIGDLIRVANQLSSDQVEKILAYQKQHGTRFGESAIALGLAKHEDVVWALSRQFDYPYINENLSPELHSALQPFGRQAEAIRNLRSQLVSASQGAPTTKKPLAVVSPCVGDGKSYICANLAVSLAQLGCRVALVDADMRTPRQHKIFDVNASTSGLSDVLASRCDVNLTVPLAGIPNLFLLPVGTLPPNPSELIQRPAFSDLLGLMLSRFDYVILDTPAAEYGADARVIAQICQSALVVGRPNHTRTRLMDNFVRELQSCSAVELLGMVMNERT
jgi:protein-tyrosine kinase